MSNIDIFNGKSAISQFKEDHEIGLKSVADKYTVEEVLMKVLAFTKQESLPDREFTRGMNCAKRQMADYIEMLIEENKK